MQQKLQMQTQDLYGRQCSPCYKRPMTLEHRCLQTVFSLLLLVYHVCTICFNNLFFSGKHTALEYLKWDHHSNKLWVKWHAKLQRIVLPRIPRSNNTIIHCKSIPNVTRRPKTCITCTNRGCRIIWSWVHRCTGFNRIHGGGDGADSLRALSESAERATRLCVCVCG